ncbi:hypothetical protein RRG08_017497 [Elysia crispata]|uniref:Uncharacterized protein n=1 Tax=Elysia crispata TaxID=231223 RepID=A0AAE1DYE3_9GAST|nr:hypothetical protein RRG08_017497 [Elysia crispata]
MEELNAPPTLDMLSCGKASGSNGIPPEIVKAGKENSLLGHLLGLLLQCWHERTLPQDMRDVEIITLYKKKKGDHSDCKNYRGMSLQARRARHSHRLSSTTSNNSLTEFTQSLSADFKRKSQQSIWFSPSGSYKRNTANRDTRCTSHSLT